MSKRILALAACFGLVASPVAAEKVKVGFIVTLTGGGGIIGKPMKNAFELGMEHVGGRLGGMETEVIYGDDKRKPDVAKQLVNKMIKKDRVQFITGHGESGALPEDLNMAALADPTATTVVYMGRRTFADFAARLIEAGLPPSTPALLAEAVSTPDQKLSRHTVESLAHLPLDPATSAPALILYGPLTE